MERPEELFDRRTEWADLVAFVEQSGASTRVALVRGRRRQGKSYLLRRLAKATNGFYYQAIEEQRNQALAGLGAALGEFLDVPGGRLAIDSWEEAFDALGELSIKGNAVVVLDEFPYLLRHSPELPSLIQRFVDRTQQPEGNGLRLILCGSALSVMAGLLVGTQALRGRVTTDVVIGTFDYRTAADFWGFDNAVTAFLVHSVVGGTPGYRDLLPATPPKRPADFTEWLAAGPLNPASALFREDDYLLTEDRSLTDRSLYHAVVGAIAGGHTSQTAVAALLGREQRSVQHPLRALVDAGFVVASEDSLRSRRPIYRVADPIIRFHHVVTRRDYARFEDRRTIEAWEDAQPRFRTHILGPHFENIARQFTFRFASTDTTGGQIASVGPAVVNDAKNRTQHEVDVVATSRRTDGSSAVLAIGEAKHTESKRTLGDLTQLEERRSLIAQKHPTAASCKLLLFSASGFDTNLMRTSAGRDDVELIDLVRLYTGE